MIREERLQKLKNLLQKDGIVIDNDGLLAIGNWLIERAKTIAGNIDGKEGSFQRIANETKTAQMLQKMLIL